MSKVVIDTSVIIEYIDMKGELHEQAKLIFSALLNGKLEVILPHPILVETYYVTTELYHKLGIDSPNLVASKFLKWLYRLPMVMVSNTGISLATEAGKAKLNYSLALTDCYVLATSKIYSCKALFKKCEREMLKNIDALRKNYEILFLEDYK